MTTYEGLFLLDANTAKKDGDLGVGQVKNLLGKHGAEVLRADKWAERRMAYTIRGQKRGVYILAWFKADPAEVKNILHTANLSELVHRVLITCHKGAIKDPPVLPEETEPGVRGARPRGEYHPRPPAEATAAAAPPPRPIT